MCVCVHVRMGVWVYVQKFCVKELCVQELRVPNKVVWEKAGLPSDAGESRAGRSTVART